MAFDPYHKWLGIPPEEQQPKRGDKWGMQPPAGGCRETHEKTRTVHSVRENASFSEVVGILENALVAEEGLEPPTRGL